MIGGGIFGKKFGFFAGGGVNYGPYTLAFESVVISRGGTLTPSEKGYLTTFEDSMSSDLAEFDRLWIHGLSNRIAAKTSFTNPSSTIMTEVNSPTWIPNLGFKGNGTTSYLNSNFNPAIHGNKYTQNNATGFVYITDSATQPRMAFGAFFGGGATAMLFPEYNTGLPIYYINCLPSDSYGAATCKGLCLVSKPNFNDVRYYKNSVLNSSNLKSSTAIPSLNIFICGSNNNGNLHSSYTNNIAYSGFGSDNYNKLNFYNAVQALGTSLGWAV